MATIQCPRCKHETHVPSLDRFAGKNVKCPSCKQAFRVDSSATPASAVDVDDFLKPQAEVKNTPFNSLPHVQWNPDAVDGPAPRIPSTETRSSGMWSLFTPLTYDPNGTTSDERYPNLLRYIGIAETLTKLFFWIGIVCVALGFLALEIKVLRGILSDELPAAEGLGMLIGIPIGAGFYVLILWLGFMFAMAMTEFLRVVIDIENNTHN